MLGTKSYYIITESYKPYYIAAKPYCITAKSYKLYYIAIKALSLIA